MHFFNFIYSFHIPYFLKMNAFVFRKQSIMPISEIADSYACYCNHDGITAL